MDILFLYNMCTTPYCFVGIFLIFDRPPTGVVHDVFLARDSICAIARYMPSPVRPSVCHRGGSVKDG